MVLTMSIPSAGLTIKMHDRVHAYMICHSTGENGFSIFEN